jgi:DNA-binding NarL/FixJ family response regulator
MPSVADVPGRTKSFTSVVIIGRLSMQNWLVAGLIDERLGCSCHVRPIYQSDAAPAFDAAIALVDIEGMSVNHVNGYARLLQTSGAYACIALMNAEQWNIEALAYLPGIRGVFMRNTSREHLLKGLRAMMAGEYWLPRHLLASHFERTRPQAAGTGRNFELTHKEIETLRLLSGGYSNIAIARRLGVSSHTVKTHVYNLSRKIGVHNRVQAAKWAMENLAGVAGPERYAGGLEDGFGGTLPTAVGE